MDWKAERNCGEKLMGEMKHMLLWRERAMDEENGSERSTKCQNLCGNIQVPTEDELTALNAMRAIKEQVRILKQRIDAIHKSTQGEKGEELPAIDHEMARLKEEWRKWEEKRRNAAKERMILLGHEEPNGDSPSL